MDDSMFREAYSFDPQSTVAQIVGYAICEMHERMEAGDELLNDAKADFWQEGHDALMGQAKTELVVQVGKSLQEHVNRWLVSNRGERFQMRSSLQTGKSWAFK